MNQENPLRQPVASERAGQCAAGTEPIADCESEPEAVSVGKEDRIWFRIDGEADALSPEKSLMATVAGAAVGGIESNTEMVGRLLGRFRLDSEIARGGMGVIFRGRDVELDRDVAVKLLLKAHLDKLHLHQQFTNEARITGRLQHPGVIPIYETGYAADDRPYFAMKLVVGTTLTELLSRRTTDGDDLPRLLKIFEQVCQTLSYTHSCGVIHLDIKPSNVMVGAFGEVHLMDWGLARMSTDACPSFRIPDPHGDCARENALNERRPHSVSAENLPVLVPEGAVCGTPSYMSPEQARGWCSDARSDVFGLGGLLCEILTGRPPYLGTDLLDICFKAARASLDDAVRCLNECGADGTLVRLALKCMAPDPDDRPADASLVATELTLYLESLLRRAESDLGRFFELSLDLFCIAGLDGFFRRVNSNFPRVLGYSEKELLSRPFMEFVHPEDRDNTVAAMSQLDLGQPVIQFRNRYCAADSQWRCFEWTAKSIPEEGIIFAVARDVTDRVLA